MNLLAFLYPDNRDSKNIYRDYNAVMLIQSVYKKYRIKKIYNEKINSLRKIQLWWRKLSQKKINKNSDSVVKVYIRKKRFAKNKNKRPRKACRYI